MSTFAPSCCLGNDGARHRTKAEPIHGAGNSTAAAYRLLERDTIIVSKGYRGTFVHPDAKAHCDVDLNASTFDKLEAAVAALREAGVTDSEIRIAFGAVMNAKNERNSQ